MSHVAFVLSDADERTTTALELADRLLARGHRVTVYAHGAAVGITAPGADQAVTASELLRRGVHGGTLDWVVDGGGAQVAGVVPGDHADLWAFVREADLVLSPGAR